jgi:hypothetical protein
MTSVLICSTVAAGHLSPLIPIALEAKKRNLFVTIGISGDLNELASKWNEKITSMGISFFDFDLVHLVDMSHLTNVYHRIFYRAAKGGQDFANAVLQSINPLPQIIIFDMFAIWGWVIGECLKQKGHSVSMYCSCSSFPGFRVGNNFSFPEMGELLAQFPSPFHSNQSLPFIPDGIPIIGFSTQRISFGASENFILAGPSSFVFDSIDSSPILQQLKIARNDGFKIIYISLGTVVMRFAKGEEKEFIPRLYQTVTLAAIQQNAIVIASTNMMSAVSLGIDLATLAQLTSTSLQVELSNGSRIDRVISMAHIPQVSLLVNVGVDLFVTHGGNNSFHESLFAATPLCVIPFFGDQFSVAVAATHLGVGVSLIHPSWNGLEDGKLVGIDLDTFLRDIFPQILSDPASYKSKCLQIQQEIISLPPSAEVVVDLIMSK